MSNRAMMNWIWLVSIVVIVTAGCGSPTAPATVQPTTRKENPPEETTTNAKSADTNLAEPKSVTLYLAGMNKEYEILWGDWPNKVKQALVELDGVTRVEDEWERELESDTDLDLLFIDFDANRITVERLQTAIKEHGFDAEVKE